MLEARPFLKWAGGKTQLLEKLLDAFPTKVNTYYEPFLGGGAVFFAMATQKRFKRAVINDWNQEIIDVYKTIRDFPHDLIEQLARLKYSREIYEELRRVDVRLFSPIRRAARTIYLNKTGFNGLYRVNKAGVFNVPFGKFATPPKIFDENTIHGCAMALNQFVKIMSTDFAVVCDDATEGDLVYFDPPYVPINPTSDFTSYTSKGFGIKDQERLARLVKDLVRRGVSVVASNSDTEIVRKLYEGFELRVLPARRNINSRGDKRGPVSELLIVSVPSLTKPADLTNGASATV